MNITETISSDLTGFCDIKTGECVIAETETSPSADPDRVQSHDRSRSVAQPPLSAQLSQ